MRQLRTGWLLVGLGLLLLPALAEARDRYTYGLSLLREGDHHRAIDALRAFRYFRPADPRVGRAQLYEGVAWAWLGEYGTALARLEPLLATTDTELAAWARLEIAETLFVAGSLPAARHHYRLAASAPVPLLAGYARYKLFWSALLDADYATAAAILRTDPWPTALPVSATTLAGIMGELQRLPTKHAWLAGTLSALVPGLGQLYDGRPWEALSAVVTVGLLGWGTYAAAEARLWGPALLLGTIGLGFYAGNVYAAVSMAHEVNQKRYRERLERAKERALVHLNPVPGGRLWLRYGIDFY